MLGTRWQTKGASDLAAEGALCGLTIGVAYVDELVLVPEAVFTMLLTRLDHPWARLYATATPICLRTGPKRLIQDNERLHARPRREPRTVGKGAEGAGSIRVQSPFLLHVAVGQSGYERPQLGLRRR